MWPSACVFDTMLLASVEEDEVMAWTKISEGFSVDENNKVAAGKANFGVRWFEFERCKKVCTLWKLQVRKTVRRKKTSHRGQNVRTTRNQL